MGILIRNWGDGHEAEINMQSLTSEDPKDQAGKWGCFQEGCRGSLAHIPIPFKKQ